EGMIGATGRVTGRVGITAIRGPKGFQSCRNAIGPVRWAVGQYIGSAPQLHQQAGVQERVEVDDTRLSSQALAQEVGRRLNDLRRQGIEEGQPAQGEAPVV